MRYAAVLVSYVAENGTWRGSTQKLNEFWDYVSTESYADVSPGFTSWWDYWHNTGGNIASSRICRAHSGLRTRIPVVKMHIVRLAIAEDLFIIYLIWLRIY